MNQYKFKALLLTVAIAFGVLSFSFAVAQVPISANDGNTSGGAPGSAGGSNTGGAPGSASGSNVGGTSGTPDSGSGSNTGGTSGGAPGSASGSNVGGTSGAPDSGSGSNTGGTSGGAPGSASGSNTGGISNPTPTGDGNGNGSGSVIGHGPMGNGIPISLPTFSGVSNGGLISSGGGQIIPPSTPCAPYINKYSTLGGNNDSNEVIKLQTFLRDFEHLNVDVNGVYDQKTFEAVKTFQLKYAADVLNRSWGITIPTGITFITTRLKINDLYCHTFTDFSNLILPKIVSSPEVTPNGQIELPTPGQEPSTTPDNIVGQNDNGNQSPNTAAVVRSGISRFFGAIGDFLGRIFGGHKTATTTTKTTTTTTTTDSTSTSSTN